MTIQIPGLPASQKTPRMYFAVILGGPGTNAGAALKSILLYGNMLQSAITGSAPSFTLAAGTASLNQVVQVFDSQSAGTLFGRGSELHLMCAAALKQFPSATLFAIPTPKPTGSPQSASATITFSIPSTALYSALTVNVYVCGRFYQYNTSATDTPTTIATGVAQQIVNAPDSPCYAQSSGPVVTITFKQPSARGNQATLRMQLVSGSASATINGASNLGYLNGLAVVIGTSSGVLTVTGAASTTTQFNTTQNPQTLGVAVGQQVSILDSGSGETAASTTIAAGSNAQTLPQATINVASTANFPTAGFILVTTSSGQQIVTYTGTTATTFTGCTGGTGTMSTGGAVSAAAFSTGTVSAVSSSSVTVGTAIGNPPNAGFQVYWANPSGQTAHLQGGTGTDSIATALSAVAATLYDRQVLAHSNGDTGSSGNINALATQLNTMAGVLTDLWQQGVAALTETYASAVTDATAVNQARMQLAWHYNSEYGPGEVAAAVAAARLIGDGLFNGQVVGEATNPATNLNGVILGGIPQQPFTADRPLASQIENALNNGLAPLQPSTAAPGFTQLVASITSRFLDASSLPNYSVWKTKVVTVSDAIALDMSQDLATQFAGFSLAPDTPDGSPIKIAKVTTPRFIRGRVITKLKGYEERGWIINVDTLTPNVAVQIDPANVGRCLLDIPEIPIPDLDSIGANIRQQSSVS